MFNACVEWLIAPLSGSLSHQIDPNSYWHGRLMVIAWSLLVPVAIILWLYEIYSGKYFKKQLKIAQVSLSSRYTWDIRTTNNMKIILSKDNVEENLTRFTSQYDNILASVKRIGSADLRYPNGFAIKKSTEPIQKIDGGERPLI